MSEKFNPLAEAEANASHDRRRFYDWVGDNADHQDNESFRAANEDMASYLRGRDYEDENGALHDATSGRFMSNLNSESEDDYYNRLQSESETGGQFDGKSLDEIAQMVAEARAEGDKTRAMDAEEAFFEKFADYSEKYGWEEEDGSADGLHVDKSAKLGRSTIDDRLERYGKIMYGAETTNTSSENAVDEDTNDTVDSADKNKESEESAQGRKFVAGEGVRVQRTSGDIEDDWTVRNQEDGNVIVEKPNPEGEGKLVKTISAADLEELQVETEEDDSNAEQPLSPALEGESQEEYEARHGVSNTGAAELEVLDEEETGADGLEVLNESDTDSSQPSRSLRDRVRSVRRRARNMMTPAGLAAEVSASAAVRREQNGRLLSRRERIAAAMGGAALMIGGGLLLMKGHDIFNGRGGGQAPTPDTTPDITPPTPGVDKIPGGGGDTTPFLDTIRVNQGDGEIKITQHILEQQGIHVNVTDAQRIGEHANVDLLLGDKNYDDAASTLDRIGAQSGTYRIRPGSAEALVASAHDLGF